jgi:hypothetical protein
MIIIYLNNYNLNHLLIMKNTFKFLFIFLFSTFLLSCVQSDKFSGSPVGIIPIETIVANVSTSVNYALPGQKINFKATLPQDFRSIATDTVTVEATTVTKVGSIRKAYVDILPGSNFADGEILVGGGVGNQYDSNFTLSLTAIKLKKEISGKHFLLTSNVLTIDSGLTSVPVDNDKGLVVQFSWQNITKQNLIQLRTIRDKSVSITFNKSFISGITKIKLSPTATITYDAIFSTDLKTTAFNFANTYPILPGGITVTAINNSLIFNYPNNTFTSPTVAPATGARVFRSGDNFLADQTKDFLIYKTQKVNSNGSLRAEDGLSAFNPGIYKFSLSAPLAATNGLEFDPTPSFRYRVILKYPDASVVIYNGVINNLSYTSGYKEVFQIEKTGMGDQTVYTPTNLNP